MQRPCWGVALVVQRNARPGQPRCAGITTSFETCGHLPTSPCSDGKAPAVPQLASTTSMIRGSSKPNTSFRPKQKWHIGTMPANPRCMAVLPTFCSRVGGRDTTSPGQQVEAGQLTRLKRSPLPSHLHLKFLLLGSDFATDLHHASVIGCHQGSMSRQSRKAALRDLTLCTS